MHSFYAWQIQLTSQNKQQEIQGFNLIGNNHARQCHSHDIDTSINELKYL